MQPYFLSHCLALTSGCLTGHTAEDQEKGKNEKKKETPALSHLCEMQGEIIFTGVFSSPAFPLLYTFQMCHFKDTYRLRVDQESLPKGVRQYACKCSAAWREEAELACCGVAEKDVFTNRALSKLINTEVAKQVYIISYLINRRIFSFLSLFSWCVRS